MSEALEFSRLFDRRHLSGKPEHLVATEAECKALSRRFGLVSIGRLEATLTLSADGDTIAARGKLDADIVQSCAVSGDDLPVSVAEKIDLRFVPQQEIAEEELELESGDLDEIPYAGHTFDVGEAVAQSLALAIDPYATGPRADQVRKEKGLLEPGAAGPFSALAALKKD